MSANPVRTEVFDRDPPESPGSDTARLRREQIIEAAMDVIANQGLHKLSLSQIEARTGMARGHLTYYFPTKEAILLAVFDRMLDRMIEQALRSGGPLPGTGRAWDCVRHLFARNLEPMDPHRQAFGSLLHTFLAQTPYRDDYRAKLAERNAEWRAHMGADFADSGVTEAPPEVVASVVMALVQGLIQQLAVDPAAFDRTVMLETLVRMLGPFFGPAADAPAGEPR
jgi:AcrR family transcriptional regulator